MAVFGRLPSLSAALLLGLLLPGAALGASTLLVSHYSGTLYTLALSDDGKLTLASQTSAGSRMPSWLTLDSAGKVLYVTDESNYGGSTLAAFSVGTDGKLTTKGTARSPGGELHSTLYGGSDGKGFLAAAE
jgi:6-phosphogluconolactonase (cycloisomerase 2 family)